MPGALIADQHTHLAPVGEYRAGVLPDSTPRQTPPAWISVLVLALACALYLALSIHLLRAGIARTGELVYPLDDTYITMAMAKNLALHGVWGIGSTSFAPASSCPGFLLLLAAAYCITGPTVWWPLVLSLAFGLLSLFVAWRLFREVNLAIQIPALLAIVIFTPLYVLGLLGMEHTLHLALILVFVDLTSRSIATHRPLSWGALSLTAAMVSVRYESLFVVGVAGLIFLAQRQIRAAIGLGIAAVTPVAIYGLASVMHGGYWLPNSIALKGTSARGVVHAPIELLHRFESCLARAPYMGALLAVMFALLAVPGVLADKRCRAMLHLVLGATLIHLALADVDWVYRYEAYLIAAAIAVIAFALGRVKISRDRWAVAAMLIFGFAGAYLLSARAVAAQRSLPERSIAVYSQQVQMARFLSRFEPGARVAANDVGAIDYYANIDCLDLVGLADRDVFRLKRQGIYNTTNLANLAASRNVQIAIVYDSWFTAYSQSQFAGPPLPPSWIRVARWRTPYGNYLGSDIVSFYAVNRDEAVKLARNLAAFAPSLPPRVQVIDGNQFFPRPNFNRPARSETAR